MRSLLLVASCLLLARPLLAQPTARFADPPAPAASASERAQPATTTPSVPAESWARSAARRLAQRGDELVRRGDVADAMRVYNDAIRMDPTFGDAYLALGRIRQAQRDWHEAERLYTAAARLRGSAAEALTRRAELRRESGREREAFDDLRAAIELEPGKHERLRELARWYVEKKAWSAALGAWRRLATELEQNGQDAELRKAKIQIRALSLLAGDTDPVAAGHDAASWVRRSLSTIARQR